MEGPDRPLFPEGVPMGLGMAMLQYPGAMEKYGALEEEAQRQLIEDAKGIPSKEEMPVSYTHLTLPTIRLV